MCLLLTEKERDGLLGGIIHYRASLLPLICKARCHRAGLNRAYCIHDILYFFLLKFKLVLPSTLRQKVFIFCCYVKFMEK
jgi:hypothetical protein